MRRWIKRGVLGVFGTLAIAAIVAIVFVHTDRGRDVIRGKLEAALAARLVGGAHVGRLEGSPFGELVVRDLVIDGPDGTPAITVKTLRVHLRLRALVHRELRVDDLVAEDVVVAIKRDPNGALELAHLLRPDTAKPRWTVDLASIAIRRASLAIETGTAEVGTANLDDVAIAGSLRIAPGGARAADLHATATWRERRAPLSLAIVARDDGATLAVPSLAAKLGEVALSGTELRLTRRGDRAPLVGGRVELAASRAAVVALLPRRALPADLALVVAVSPGTSDAQPIALTGTLGSTAFDAHVTADLDARHVIGTLATGDLDLALVTDVRGRGAIVASFDARPGAPGELPVGTARALAHVVYQDRPRADLVVAVASDGRRVTTSVAVSGPATATLDAALVRTGDAIALDHATLVGAVADPRGSLDIALTARGALVPRLALDVSGRVHGSKLRLHDVALDNLVVEVEAARVSAEPHATARVRIDGLARGATVLPHLDLRVGVVSRADTVWIDVRDPARTIAIVGTIARDGDLAMHASIAHLALATIRDGYAGFVIAHADVARTAGAWRGTLDATAKDLAVASLPALELTVKAAARPGTVTVAATAVDGDRGTLDLALDVAAPARLDDVAAWRARGRTAIRKARLRITGVELAPIAALAGIDARGVLAGTVELDATTVAADLDVHGLQSPSLRGIRAIDAALAVRPSGIDALVASLTVAVAEVGTVSADAHLAIPIHLLDPGAWRALGSNALRDASIRTDAIAIDPALLDRFGITSPLRGSARARIDVGEGLRSIAVRATVSDLRGTPFARPVTIEADGAIDDRGATATLAMAEPGQPQPQPLVSFAGRVAVTLAELRAAPARWRTAALVGKLALPRAPARELLQVFGRNEITGGTIEGTVDLAGTLGRPTFVAHVVGAQLGVPPGPRGKPVQIVDEIVVDATGDARGGRLTAIGSEGTTGKLSVVADLKLAALADGTARIRATAFDLSPLLAFAPGPAGGARGTLDADLTVVGFDVRTAKIVGQLHLRGARVPLAPTIGTLREATVDVAIHPRDIAIAATGKLGRGDVKLDGTIALDGVALASGRLKLALRHVSPIGAIEPVVDADVAIELAREHERWRATVAVDHAFVKVTSARGEAVKPSTNPADLTIGRAALVPRPKPGTPRPANTAAIVANVALHGVRVESAEFRTTLDGQLALELFPDRVQVVGEVTAQSGDLDLFDRRYHVEQADVRFDGTTDPLVAVRITHDFSDVTTVTTVSGRISKPHLELASDPGTYSQSELLGFLLGGEPGGDPNSASARDKVTGAGTSLIAGQIGGYVKRALPFDVDVIRYETATVGSSAALTVGTWLTHTLFFAYRQHLASRPDENSGEGVGEYWITRRLEIEATAGDRSVDSVDLLWRRRF